MSRRQHRYSGLVAVTVMLAMFAVVMTFYHDSPPPEPKQPCVCSEGLRPVTYEILRGHKRKCMPHGSWPQKKAQDCQFDKEEKP